MLLCLADAKTHGNLLENLLEMVIVPFSQLLESFHTFFIMGERTRNLLIQRLNKGKISLKLVICCNI